MSFFLASDALTTLFSNTASMMWVAIVSIVGLSVVPGCLAGAYIKSRRNRQELEAIVKLSEQGHSVDEIEQLLKRAREGSDL